MKANHRVVHQAQKPTTDVIGSSDTRPKTEGTKAFRIVLRFLGASNRTPYVVHMETLNEDGSHDGFHNGNYCDNMLEGYNTLVARSAKYNLRVRDSRGKRIPLADLAA
jgi:hypothetical protein